MDQTDSAVCGLLESGRRTSPPNPDAAGRGAVIRVQAQFIEDGLVAEFARNLGALDVRAIMAAQHAADRPAVSDTFSAQQRSFQGSEPAAPHSWRTGNCRDLRTAPRAPSRGGSTGHWRIADDSRKMRARSENQSCSTRSLPSDCFRIKPWGPPSIRRTVFETPPPSECGGTRIAKVIRSVRRAEFEQALL